MSVLVIAEKPSVARDIAKVLGCTKKDNGMLYGNNYVVSWAIGHLVGLKDPDEYDPALKKWKFEALPIIPSKIDLKVLPKTKEQFEILKKLMNSPKVEEIVCATDSGREGELIFRYIYEAAKCDKPFKRLWISSMTDSSIKKGFKALKPGREYDNLFYSAKCRSEADWLVGINASRAYTIKYNALLTIGRVQTPTLSLLVANKKEIDEFVPTKYWEVVATFDSYNGTWYDKISNETKISDEQKAKDIIKKIKGKSGEIVDIQTEEKRRPHPLLFDLTELQRECNKKFGYSAKKTLDLAQALYEKHKVITYPRTDSRHLSTDMADGVQKVLKSFKGGRYDKLLEYPLSLEPLPITKRIADDGKVTDHHAIIPTGKKPPGLSKDEENVFDLIVRRLIAAFYPDYTYSITKVFTLSEDESFLSKGQTIIDLGWMAVLGKETEESDLLPALTVGDKNDVTKTKLNNKSTQPPKPYTEASLLSAMENAGRFVDDEQLKEQLKESGLGTPATRAAIIERLIDVGYVKREKKNLMPTDKAVKLIEIVPNELKSPETTAKWERALTSIAKGAMQTDKFDKSIEKYVRHIIDESKKINRSVVFEQEARGKPPKGGGLGKCPTCDGVVLENSKSFYCSNWKAGCKFTIWKNSLEKSSNPPIELTAEMIKRLLADKKIDGIKISLASTKQAGTCSLALEPEKDMKISITNFKPDSSG